MFSRLFSRSLRITTRFKVAGAYTLLLAGLSAPIFLKQRQQYLQAKRNSLNVSWADSLDLHHHDVLLMLDYYSEKKNIPLFLARNEGILTQAIFHFVKSKDENLLLMTDHYGHWSVVKCEKYQNKNYIIVLDSIPGFSECFFLNCSRELQLNHREQCG